MYTCFEVSINADIAHIRMNRPDKRNSMIPQFWSELYEIVEQIDQQASARVIVISSTGPHFSSGMDLSVFKAMLNAGGSALHTVPGDTGKVNAAPVHETRPGPVSSVAFYQLITSLQRTFTRIEQCRIPVLAAVQGACIGAGLALVSACDCRFASHDAYFSIHETNLAMTADVGTFPRICRLMADGLVRELAFTGRRLPAAEALQAGLINRMYADHDELLDAVMNMAATIAVKSPMAVTGCKQVIRHAGEHTNQASLDYASLWSAAHMQLTELAEAMSAGLEQRQPKFSSLPQMPNQPGTGLDFS